MKRRVTPAVAVLAAAAALSAGLSVMPAQASSDARQAVDAIPQWATPTADAGPMAASATIDARVYLASRDPAGLDAFVAAVSDPSSDQYQQYLTPEQAAARFGSRDGAADRVAAWLRSAGLTVTGSN